MTLPTDIKHFFFDTLSGDKTVLEFEKWLYADERLEIILNYPDLDTEIIKVISWLDTNKAVVTGIKDDNNQFEYIDKRTELEKQPTC